MVVGLAVSLVNVLDGFKDRRAMKQQNINGAAKILVESSLGTDISRSIQFFLLLTLGIFSAYTPRIFMEVHGFFWWQRLVTYVTLLGVGGLLTFNAISTRLAARKALALTKLKRR